ncbi:MAG: hypothetical protein J3Q66DRAFT_366805 [Benniella sp.]|nr:MAG: hypothetical protein J3Q66DRAFT_366805 [Benniella sp.]
MLLVSYDLRWGGTRPKSVPVPLGPHDPARGPGGGCGCGGSSGERRRLPSVCRSFPASLPPVTLLLLLLSPPVQGRRLCKQVLQGTSSLVASDAKVWRVGRELNQDAVRTKVLPSKLSELNLNQEFFIRLFQVQTPLETTRKYLKNQRVERLQEYNPFPTLGTPERPHAMRTPSKVAKSL